jgi:hypothetical protein
MMIYRKIEIAPYRLKNRELLKALYELQPLIRTKKAPEASVCDQRGAETIPGHLIEDYSDHSRYFRQLRASNG